METLALTKELYINIVSWAENKYSINTINQYKIFLKSIFKKYGQLDKEVLRKVMAKVKYQNQRAALSMINKYCYENNLDFSIHIPGIKNKRVSLPEILSPEEIEIIINSAPPPYNLTIRCIFNMGAGLRISEIIKFKWNHIRWAEWVKNKDNYGIALIKSGKGSKDRVVNIPKKLMFDLYEYAKKQSKLNEFGIPEGGAIFDFGGFNKKTPMNRRLKSNIKMIDDKWKNEYVRSRYNWFRYNILQKHCEKALNKHLKIHHLRHSRATYLYEYENVPVEKIQILLGHSSLNTTMLYTKVNPRKLFELIKDTKEL